MAGKKLYYSQGAKKIVLGADEGLIEGLPITFTLTITITLTPERFVQNCEIVRKTVDNLWIRVFHHPSSEVKAKPLSQRQFQERKRNLLK